MLRRSWDIWGISTSWEDPALLVGAAVAGGAPGGKFPNIGWVWLCVCPVWIVPIPALPPAAGVTSVSPSSWQWPLGHRAWNKMGIFFPVELKNGDFLPCNPVAGRGGMGTGLFQWLSSRNVAWFWLQRKPSPIKFLWQNPPFGPVCAGIPTGNQDCAEVTPP